MSLLYFSSKILQEQVLESFSFESFWEDWSFQSFLVYLDFSFFWEILFYSSGLCKFLSRHDFSDFTVHLYFSFQSFRRTRFFSIVILLVFNSARSSMNYFRWWCWKEWHFIKLNFLNLFLQFSSWEIERKRENGLNFFNSQESKLLHEFHVVASSGYFWYLIFATFIYLSSFHLKAGN